MGTHTLRDVGATIAGQPKHSSFQSGPRVAIGVMSRRRFLSIQLLVFMNADVGKTTQEEFAWDDGTVWDDNLNWA